MASPEPDPEAILVQADPDSKCSLFSQLGKCCIGAFYRSGRTTLGMLYFIFVLSCGVVLSLSAAIKKPPGVNENYINYFFVFCMAPGILWMIGACACPTPSLGCCLTPREPGSQIPCYMMFGVTVFCLGSSFISGVDFLNFVYGTSCNSSIPDTEINKKVMASDGIFSLVKLFFLISQLHFLCRFSNVSFKRRPLTSFFILHIIAVNLTTWFYFIVNESVAAEPPHNYTDCPTLQTMDTFVTSADIYMYPFNIEYTIMSSVLFFLMWYELWDKDKTQKDKTQKDKTQMDKTQKDKTQKDKTQQKRSEACCSLARLCTSCCREVPIGDTEGDPKTMLFWKSSPIGYVLGILILTIQLVVLVVSGLEYKANAPSAIAYYSIRIVLYIVMTGLSIWGLCCLPRHRASTNSRIHTRVDSILIILGVIGCYLMTFFNVSSAISDLYTCKHIQDENLAVSVSSHGNSSKAHLIVPVSCRSHVLGLFTADIIVSLVQFTLQTIFITQALRRRVEEISLQTPSSRRVICNVAAVLIFANMGVWVMDTFELKEIHTVSSIETIAYGEGAWRILSHIAFPLCIFFRLHSAFCFFEININRFGMEAKKNHTRSRGYHPVRSLKYKFLSTEAPARISCISLTNG